MGDRMEDFLAIAAPALPAGQRAPGCLRSEPLIGGDGRRCRRCMGEVPA